jgi:hypothetical protein
MNAEKVFMILVIRLLAALVKGMAGQPTRRMTKVLTDADDWVTGSQQGLGLPLSLDYLVDPDSGAVSSLIPPPSESDFHDWWVHGHCSRGWWLKGFAHSGFDAGWLAGWKASSAAKRPPINSVSSEAKPKAS